MDEPGELNVLEELKNKLDSELDTCQRYQILQLMKRHLGPVYGEFLAREDDWSPSELLDYLENNMLESQALTILSHIFSEMRLHNTTTYEPFIDYINKYFEAKGCFYHDDLIGRKKELEDIKMEIGTRKGVWVYGQGGLGKTTLVNEVCTRMKNVKKTLVKKVNLKQTQFLSTMMKLIIKQFNASFNEDVEEDLSIETVTVCLKETLNKEGRDLLLFLDNVENVYEREKEFPATINSLLRIHKNVKWIMTSRLPFESSEEDLCHYNLGPLSSMDAQTLLRLYCRPVRFLCRLRRRT
ncbi:uncharacterized protein LOC127851749 isoform X2 [Dreissena polymorpha]|uniref:uncharacterized protein LOC127851749 isoform X2 n=1 Tax=Dreissena polymorpha TaxID=45954 RepID=UPI002263DEF0|nr:uncharacterized protein LOC127851749 isoform X2 [Dreissena polymorpha]